MVVSIDSDCGQAARKTVVASTPDTPGADRRRNRRLSLERLGTAVVLGSRDLPTACRIVDISRSGMRIQLKKSLPVGAQVHVQWDDQFFVGSTCYRLDKREDHVYGLELVTCSYVRLPGTTMFALGRLALYGKQQLTDLLGRMMDALWNPGRKSPQA